MSSSYNEIMAMSLPSWLPIQGLHSLNEKQQVLWASLVAALVILSVYKLSSRKPFPAPYVGYRSWFEPTFLVRLRSVISLRNMIEDAYSKVKPPTDDRTRSMLIPLQKYKHGFFIVRAIDSDIVVMPNRYLEEIRLLPESTISSTVAQGDVSSLFEPHTVGPDTGC